MTSLPIQRMYSACTESKGESHGLETNKIVKDKLDGGGAHLTPALGRQGQAELCESEVSPVHIASTSAGSKATQRYSASKKKKRKKEN